MRLPFQLLGRHDSALGGASCLGAGRPGSGALPPVISGVRPGPTTHHLQVRGVRAWEPVTNPSARSCELALCAVGAARGHPGGPLLPGCGVSGVGRSPNPDRPSIGACGRSLLSSGCRCGGSWRGDLSPTKQRALLRAGFARCRGSSRAPRGGAPCLAVGRPGSGALPAPTACPLGRAAGAHYPLAASAGGAGVGTRHQPHNARSCELALRAVVEARGHPGGVRLMPASGAPGVGRSPTHDRPSFGACGRGPLPTGCPWHLSPCRGSSYVVRASRVCGTRWPLCPETCPRAVVVGSGVSLWRAS